LWKSRNYHKLVKEYERDVVLVSAINHKASQTIDLEKLTYCQAVELIDLDQMKRACQTIVSNSCSDPSSPHVVDQMKDKFLARKEVIAAPSDAQFDNPIEADELKKSDKFIETESFHWAGWP